MNLKELEKLIQGGESEDIEFKKTTAQQRQGTKTVCALLNGLGGWVFYGIDDKGKAKGQEVTTKTLEKLVAEHRLISPPAFPEIETVPVSDKLKVIVVRVTGRQGLYTYEDRAYLRHGPTTSIMPREEYERRLMEKLHGNHRWESEYAPDEFTLSDLDEDEIQTTFRNGLHLGRIKAKESSDTETILRGLKLIKDDKLLNAAIALYGKSDAFDPTFPQFSIKVARFRGNDRLAEFADNRWYKDHAFGILRRAENFLYDHMPIAGRKVSGKMRREDYPLYPPLAFREAVANAICHRDYTFAGGAIAVAMYDDHLEVINPGTFHFGMTPKKLTRPHESRPWNPLVANAFYCAGIIESWGSGTLNILDMCQENGNPPPKWEERTECVFMTFSPRIEEKARPKRPESELESRPESRLESEPESKKDSLEKKVIKTLKKGPLSASEIAHSLGHKSISGGLRKTLRELIDSEIIKYTIPEKKGSRLQKYALNDRKAP